MLYSNLKDLLLLLFCIVLFWNTGSGLIFVWEVSIFTILFHFPMGSSKYDIHKKWPILQSPPTSTKWTIDQTNTWQISRLPCIPPSPTPVYSVTKIFNLRYANQIISHLKNIFIGNIANGKVYIYITYIYIYICIYIYIYYIYIYITYIYI